MQVEHLAYPWRKDLEKMEKFYIHTIDSLINRINALETRIQYLEPNQKYETVSTNTAGVTQVKLLGRPGGGGAGGGTSGQAWGGGIPSSKVYIGGVGSPMIKK